MFLEPHSQIVPKELVGAVEMDLSVEKVCSIWGVDPVVQGYCSSEIGLSGESCRISQLRLHSEQFAGQERETYSRTAQGLLP